MDESVVESSIEVAADLTEKGLIHVLHVDDDAGFLKVARQPLEMQGSFQVDTATSVEEAMEKMKKKTFDAIVSDYVMPGKDGLQFLKELRDSGNDVPFIMFTGKGREEVAIKSLNLGADQYLNKIGDPETIYCELAYGVRKAAERKKGATELWRREQRLRAILTSSPDNITVSDLQGKIVDCNEAAWKLTGFSSKEELLGKSSFEFIAEKDRKRAGENLKKTLEEGRARNVEYTLTKKDGEEYIGELSASILKDSAGNPIGFVGVVRDITERKKAEEKLRAAERSWSDSFNALEDVMSIVNKDYTIEKINDIGLRLLREAREEVIGKKCYKVIHGVDAPCEFCPGKKTLKTGKVNSVDRYEKLFDKYFSIKITPIFNERGEIIGFVDLMRDITERKRAEKEMKKFKTISDMASYGTVVSDPEGNLLYVNEAYSQMHGYMPEELVGKNLSVFHTEEQMKDVMRLNEYLKKEGSYTAKEVGHKRKDGTVFPTLMSATFIKSEKGIPLFLSAIAVDITERKKTEQELRDTNENWVSLMENTDDVIMILDCKGTIQDVNLSPLVANPREVIGKSVYEYVPREQHDIMRESLRKVFKTGKPDSYEVSPSIQGIGTIWFNTKVVPIKHDKKTVSVILISTNITERKKAKEALKESREKFERLFMDNPEAAVHMDSDFHILDVNPRFKELFEYSLDEIKGKHIDNIVVPKDKIEEAEILDKEAGKGYVYHDTVRMRKDGSLVPVSVSAAAITVENQLLGYVAVYKDISQLKQTEEELKKTLEKVQVLNERLSVVGRLTRHDVRTKLSAVTGNVFLAKQKLTSDHEALKYLGEIEPALQQIERIFDFARTYEKLGVEELAYVDVEKTIGEAVSLFSDLHGVKVVNDCHGLTLLADSLLRQILYNLIHNSLKHGETVSQIRVYYEAGKNNLKLVYEDDGVGIPKAEKEKIFNEGYGKGTGYGLYLIRKMCEVYGWTIEETGKHGNGAQFTITIPEMNEKGKINYQLN